MDTVETKENQNTTENRNENEETGRKRTVSLRLSTQPEIPVISNFVKPKGRMVIIKIRSFYL